MMAEYPKNVLLVVLDSVRAKNMGLYGHHRDTTPFLDDFAERSTMYEHAIAPSHWSLPSHVSFLTGHHTDAHGIVSEDEKLASGSTVFDDLSAAGFETGAFSSNLFLTGVDTGLADSFDVVKSSDDDPPLNGIDPRDYNNDALGFVTAAIRSGRPFRSAANGAISKLAWEYPNRIPDRFLRSVAGPVTPGSVYTDYFLDWMENCSGRWAACINYMDAHTPYHPRKEHRLYSNPTVDEVALDVDTLPMSIYDGTDPWWKLDILENLYDAAIRDVDEELSRLIGELKRRNEYEDTLIVITSDHGEAFGERSPIRDIPLANHLIGAHEVNLHVPLLVKYPNQTSGDVVSSPASLTRLPEVIANPSMSEQGFVPEGPVLASSHAPPLQSQHERLSTHRPDADRFNGVVRVRYDEIDGYVKKTMSWRDSTVVRAVYGVDAVTTLDDSPEDVGIFDSLDDPGISIDSSDDIDSGTVEQLENLGYR